MSDFRNLITGMIVSLAGSLPFGAINIIALQFYLSSGLNGLLLFSLGVISIEWLLIFALLKGGQWLTTQHKFVLISEIASILFLFFLALSFLLELPRFKNPIHEKYLFQYSPFLAGIFINAINFIQIPFWSGWNVYLINSRYINVIGRRKYSYINGTSIGTLGGILLFVFFLHYFSDFSKPFFNYSISIVCFCLSFFQSHRLYQKHFA